MARSQIGITVCAECDGHGMIGLRPVVLCPNCEGNGVLRLYKDDDAPATEEESPDGE